MSLSPTYPTSCTNDPDYGQPTADGYHTKLSSAFRELIELSGAKAPRALTVDCANGVGAVQFRQTLTQLTDVLQVRLIWCKSVFSDAF